MWAGFLRDVAAAAVGFAFGILGTIVGVILDRWIRSRGKVLVYFERWALTFTGRDRLGGQVEVSPDADPSGARYGFVAEIHNQRGEVLSLRRLRLALYFGDKRLAEEVPEEAEATLYAGQIHREEVHVLAAPAGELVRRGFAGSFEPRNVPSALEADRVYLEGEEPGGNSFRLLIAQRSPPGRDWKSPDEPQRLKPK